MSRSTNVIKAYEVSKEIISDILEKKEKIDIASLESSLSGIIFEIVSREQTIEAAARQSLIDHLKKTEPNGNKRFLEKVQKVTIEDLYRVLNNYIKDLFDTKKNSLVVTTNPSKLSEIEKGFRTLGRPLEPINSLEEFFS